MDGGCSVLKYKQDISFIFNPYPAVKPMSTAEHHDNCCGQQDKGQGISRSSAEKFLKFPKDAFHE